MMTNIQAIATEAELAKAIEEASRRHVPYVAVIRQQNTVHRSITINVLHGTPQGKSWIQCKFHPSRKQLGKGNKNLNVVQEILI